MSTESRIDQTSLRAIMMRKALSLGFCEMRIARADDIPDQAKHLADWLDAGHHAGMEWMQTRKDQRRHPQALWPACRSVLVLGFNYAPAEDPLATLSKPEAGTVSVYARNRDYHDIIKSKLKELAGFLVAQAGGEVKVFVDTAPVMEKPIAMQAGLGWQGKHTVLLSRRHGNWLFLGFIFSTLDLEPDAPETEHCGTCRRCLDICPTGAFPHAGVLDSRLCISYLTIEHAGTVPRHLRPLMGNRIYGCDDCLAVCPWNRFAKTAQEAKLKARDDLIAPALSELVQLDDAAFRRHFSGSPIKRIGRDRFIRNVLIAIGNSGSPALIASAHDRLTDASALVRAAAVWALSRLSDATDFRALAFRLAPGETDADVAAEWTAALAEAKDISA